MSCVQCSHFYAPFPLMVYAWNTVYTSLNFQSKLPLSLGSVPTSPHLGKGGGEGPKNAKKNIFLLDTYAFWAFPITVLYTTVLLLHVNMQIVEHTRSTISLVYPL